MEVVDHLVNVQHILEELGLGVHISVLFQVAPLTVLPPETANKKRVNELF